MIKEKKYMAIFWWNNPTDYYKNSWTNPSNFCASISTHRLYKCNSEL